MIKHLAPFSEEHIKEIKSKLTPIERISEEISDEMHSLLENYKFEYNDEQTRINMLAQLNKINSLVQFTDITVPDDIHAGIFRYQGSIMMQIDKIKIFSITITNTNI